MGKLILIAGVSRSGKTTLTKYLNEHLNNCLVIHQDRLVLPKAQIPKVRDRIDWERPESIDWTNLFRLLTESASSYDYIIVEGIFALSNKKLVEQSDYSIALEIDKESYLERRKLETRWGTEPAWFLEHVWDSHLKYHNPYNIEIDTILTNPTQSDYSQVLNEINKL